MKVHVAMVEHVHYQSTETSIDIRAFIDGLRSQNKRATARATRGAADRREKMRDHRPRISELLHCPQ